MWSQSASLLSNIGHPLPAQFFLEPTLLYTFLGGMGLSLSKLVLSNIHQYHIHTHLSQVKCLPMSLPWLRASMTVENREGIAGMGRTTFSTCWLKKGGFKQATILHFSGHLERMGVGGRWQIYCSLLSNNGAFCDLDIIFFLGGGGVSHLSLHLKQTKQFCHLHVQKFMRYVLN